MHASSSGQLNFPGRVRASRQKALFFCLFLMQADMRVWPILGIGLPNSDNQNLGQVFLPHIFQPIKILHWCCHFLEFSLFQMQSDQFPILAVTTTSGFTLTLFRMAIVRNANDKKYRFRCGKGGTFIYCWWACKLIQPL